MRLKEFINEYNVIKPVKPKPDKKSWSVLDSYTTKKLKEWLRKNKIKPNQVWRIMGSFDSHNFDNDRQTTVNFETTDGQSYSVTINMVTGDVYKE